MAPTGVFLVEDNEDARMVWRLAIESGPADLQVVAEASDATEALDNPVPADVYVVDHLMPGMSGLDLIRTLRARGVEGPMILCSAMLTADLADEAEQAGAVPLDKMQSVTLPDVIAALAGGGPVDD